MSAPDSFEQEEYFALLKAVAEFDQRLLTVKGWGVTLSLAALGFGFQYRAYGLFLVAAVSGVAFWIIEHAAKRHQMRHYVRMREIEAARYQRADPADKATSAPRIDWSWERARDVLDGRAAEADRAVSPRGENPWHARAWWLPHVMLPHALTLAAGALLFALGVADLLPGFALGPPPPPAK
jgi:hypothetical protein